MVAPFSLNNSEACLEEQKKPQSDPMCSARCREMQHGGALNVSDHKPEAEITQQSQLQTHTHFLIKINRLPLL